MSGSIPQVLLKIKVFISRELNFVSFLVCLSKLSTQFCLLLKLNYRTTFLLSGCQVNCGIMTVAYVKVYNGLWNRPAKRACNYCSIAFNTGSVFPAIISIYLVVIIVFISKTNLLLWKRRETIILWCHNCCNTIIPNSSLGMWQTKLTVEFLLIHEPHTVVEVIFML